MKRKIYMAPMAGLTDLAFRLISREFGAHLCFFEMLDANSIVHAHPRSLRLIKTVKKDRPLAAQLLGGDPSALLDAAHKIISLAGISFIELNAACPAPKALRKKSGAHLLKDPARLEDILKKLSSGLGIPVTVKLRTGLNKRDPKETVRISQLCEASGASTVFLHGRTAAQAYAGQVDYASIKAVKEAVKIPLFGSGDILSPPQAKQMFDETGCDGILVARGALGNPWIFKDIENYIERGKIPKKQPLSVRKRALLKHLAYIDKYKEMLRGNKQGFMGKVTTWYLKGLPNASRIRDRIYRSRSYGELKKVIREAGK